MIGSGVGCKLKGGTEPKKRALVCVVQQAALRSLLKPKLE